MPLGSSAGLLLLLKQGGDELRHQLLLFSGQRDGLLEDWYANAYEAIEKGQRFAAKNLVNKANGATRFVHPTTGRSIVIDDVTKEVLHVGGDGFKY